MMDKAGNSYPTVIIGGQTWMAKNLAWLPSVNVMTDNSIIDAKYYVNGYDDTDVATAKSESNYITYGVLYNYQAALTACPTGWHLPSDAEWQALEVSLGMTPIAASEMFWRGTDQGDQIKSTTLWNSGGIVGTNSSGFSAFPAGSSGGGSFQGVGYYAYFWAATANGASYAWYRSLSYNSASINRFDGNQAEGFSVRCLKDSN